MENESRQSTDLFLAVMEKHPEGVIVLDANDRVKFINPMAQALMGPAGKESLVGKPLHLPDTEGETKEIEIKRWRGLMATVEIYGVKVQWNGQPARVVFVRDVSERKIAKEALREERDFSTSLVQNSPAFFVAVGSDGRTLMMNEAMTRTLGYKLDEVLGSNYLETFLSGPDREEVSRIFDTLVKQKGPARAETRVITSDGRELLVEWHIKPVYKSGSEVSYFFNMGIDVTQRRQAEAQLQESEKRYRSLLEATTEGIAVHENGMILDANEALESLFGFKTSEFVDKPVFDLIAEESREFVRENIKAGKEDSYEAVCLKKDGTRFHAQISEKSHVYIGRNVRVILLRDITELVKLRDKLVEMSHLDSLTGLSNRRGFNILAYQQIKLADRTKKGIVLLFVDLDNMKWINDNLGHSTGDKALVDFAAILKDTLRKSDIVARIGGDEFIVLGIEAHPESESIIIARLRENLEKFNKTSDRNYSLSVSVGTAYYDPENPTTLDYLLEEADAMMYEEKRRKKR